jgi:hypothetical protein
VGLRHLRHSVAVTEEVRARRPAERLLAARVMRLMGLLGLGGTVRLIRLEAGPARA